MILLTCKTLRETRLRIKAVRDITLTLTLTMKLSILPQKDAYGSKKSKDHVSIQNNPCQLGNIISGPLII